MKKILTIIFVTLVSLSCSDSINDLLDELNMTVPICVDSGALSGGDGRGWAHAVPTITDALNLVQSGGEIWLKAGTYNISSSIIINKSVSIFGGFNGTEQRSSERNIAANTTTIQPSGGINAFSISGFQGNIFFDGIKFTGTGKGLSIATSSVITVNNCTFSSLSSATSGAALYINESSVILNNCDFTNNSSSSVGGAIYATSSTNAELVISHCSFINNYANTNGGAITTFSTTGNVKLTINNSSEFRTNWTSNSSGGALYCGYGTITKIYNSIFNENGSATHASGASNGGAIYITNTIMALTNCTFTKNTVTSNGGAIYAESGSAITIIGTDFGGENIGTGNTADMIGGAIFVSGSSITINNSNFNRNSATNSNGGAIYVYGNSNISILNSTFNNNKSAARGGAISVYNSSGTSIELSISASTFTGNSTTSSNEGGAIATSGTNVSSSITLRISNNSIFTNNKTYNANGGAIYSGYYTSAYIYDSDFISNGHVDTYPPYGASYGGAIYFNGNAYCIVSGCDFNGNDSSSYGGAISFSATPDAHVINSNFNNNTTAYMSGGGGAIGVFDSTSKVYIDNSEFVSNSTNESASVSDGGAIYCYLGSTSISSCKFNSNVANNSSGGAIYSRPGVVLSIVNSLFYNNEANGAGVAEGLGGALYIQDNSTYTFDNLTFYSNIASDNGGAIYFANSAAPTIYNSVFFNNIATNAGKNIYSFSVTTIQYCFYNNGLSGVTIGTGCINNSVSPFVSVTSTDNTFLYPANIIIDAGNNAGVPSGVTTDLARNPRFADISSVADTGNGTAPIVDIGAYEAQ
jgi:predicted outer membrane repeat protein/parallel beta-helix repeat protein